MTEHFCTYFDHRYAPQALAMWRSLKKHSPFATLHILCLTDTCREIVKSLELPDVHLHSLQAIERDDSELVSARANRTFVEYYFTLTPCLPLYLLTTSPDIARLTYIDADTFFFANPQPIFDELGDCAIGIVEHRFCDEFAHLERYGRFNVGWLTFRNDSIALECLRSWRRQCLVWCFDRVEDGRFAEQKYLDDWPERFDRVHVIRDKGANVAPWNLNRYAIADEDGAPTVDGEPLLFFHASGFRLGGPGRPPIKNLDTYRVRPSQSIDRSIYAPYENAVADAAREIALPLALTLLAADQPRDATARIEELEGRLAIFERQLSENEQDRAARLRVIEQLARQLETSEADRAARLDVIEALDRRVAMLERQLAESEEDRAARLRVIQELDRQLQTTEADRAARLEMIHALNAHRAGLERDLWARQAELDRTAADLQQARAVLSAIEASVSWRLTRPLRSLGRHLRQ